MFYREKAYTRINWKNRPNLSTPLGAKNLNKMDATLNELDDRIIEVSSEVEQNGLNIVLMSGEINALEENVAQNTSQIEKISNLAEDVNELKIVNTASGSTAYMDDASNMGLEGIDFYGESKQDGTPTPTSPIPIESKIVNRVDVLRKNFLNNTAQSITDAGLTYTVNDDKSVTVNGTATGLSIVKVGTFKNTDRDLILSGCASGGSNSTYKLSYYHETTQVNDFGSGVTLPKNDLTYEVRIVIYGGTTINNLTFYPMIRLANTDDTYEPYQEQTVYLTNFYAMNGLNGVRDCIDAVRGVHRAHFGVVVFDGSENWIGSSYLAGRYGIEIKAKATGICMCSMAINRLVETVNCCHINQHGSFYINTSFATVDEWKSHLQANPMTVVYEMAEPIETALPQTDVNAIKALHSYKPNTVVMNDADAEMDVHYVADPRLYVDRKIESLANSILAMVN